MGKRFVGKSEQIISPAREVFMKRFFIFIFLFFSLAGFSFGQAVNLPAECRKILNEKHRGWRFAKILPDLTEKKTRRFTTIRRKAACALKPIRFSPGFGKKPDAISSGIKISLFTFKPAIKT